MANYNLDLKVMNPRQNEFPGPTIAQIYVKTYSKDDKGLVYITPQCVTFSEIDAQCDRLVNEIESIRRRSKKILGK
jgi:hypothetical protein